MRPVVRILVLLTASSLTSCLLGDREEISPIIDTNLPETAIAGQTISFTIYHILTDGCGKFSRIEPRRDGNTITITAYGKYPKIGACPDVVTTLETPLEFHTDDKGTYYFRFYSDNYDGHEYLLDTLIVQ